MLEYLRLAADASLMALTWKLDDELAAWRRCSAACAAASCRRCRHAHRLRRCHRRCRQRALLKRTSGSVLALLHHTPTAA